MQVSLAVHPRKFKEFYNVYVSENGLGSMMHSLNAVEIFGGFNIALSKSA